IVDPEESVRQSAITTRVRARTLAADRGGSSFPKPPRELKMPFGHEPVVNFDRPAARRAHAFSLPWLHLLKPKKGFVRIRLGDETPHSVEYQDGDPTTATELACSTAISVAYFRGSTLRTPSESALTSTVLRSVAS